jgi:methionine-rich copper-binding protein CopC
MTMRISSLVGALVMTCLSLSAQSHAFLDHAEPKVGATVQSTPSEVKLWFSEDLEPAFSRVEVRDGSGKRVDKADARIEPTDHSLLRVSLPALGPGVYLVVWRAVSIDTHVTTGDFVFRVRP